MDAYASTSGFAQPHGLDISATEKYRRAANYTAAAQTYLQENPLLGEPLKPEHIKPRLLGHWGTVPGINLIYAHLNNLILRTGASVLPITGLGHGAAANLADPTIFGTITTRELTALFSGYGYAVSFVDFSDEIDPHMACTVSWAYEVIRRIQSHARVGGGLSGRLGP